MAEQPDIIHSVDQFGNAIIQEIQFQGRPDEREGVIIATETSAPALETENEKVVAKRDITHKMVPVITNGETVNDTKTFIDKSNEISDFQPPSSSGMCDGELLMTDLHHTDDEFPISESEKCLTTEGASLANFSMDTNAGDFGMLDEKEMRDKSEYNFRESTGKGYENNSVSNNQTDEEKLDSDHDIVHSNQGQEACELPNPILPCGTMHWRKSSNDIRPTSEENKCHLSGLKDTGEYAFHSDHSLLSTMSNDSSEIGVRRKSALDTIPETEKEYIEARGDTFNRRHSSCEGNMKDVDALVMQGMKKIRRRSRVAAHASNVNASNNSVEQINQHLNDAFPTKNGEIEGDYEGNAHSNSVPPHRTCSEQENERQQESVIPQIEIHDPEGHSRDTSICYDYVEEEFLVIPPDFSRRNTETNVQITDLDDDDEIHITNDLEIDFDDLDNDVKDAIASIDNLSSGVSDGGSTTTRRSTFKIGDDTSYRNKINETVNETKQMAVPQYPGTETHFHYTKNIKKKDISPQSSNTLSYKDVQGVSATLKGSYPTERRAIRSSISGVDFGTIKEISRNIDLNKGSVRSGGSHFSSLGRSRSQLLSESSEDGSNVRIYPSSEKWRILKNLIFISLAFMILFTAFNTTQAYQSSLNAKRGLGSWSLVVYYFTLMVANMFLPVMITKWLGCKGSMVVSCLLFAPYIMAQFYPTFYTLLPTSAAAGMGGGVLFCAQGTYASVMAETYMTVTGVDKETTMMLFFGIFFFLYLMSLLWGNLISAEVLLTGSTTYTQISCNVTKFCGSNFCPSTPTILDNENLIRPPEERLSIIWGTLLALVFVAAAVLVLGVDSLCRYNETERSIKRGFSGCQLLAASLKHLGNPYQLLLIPVSALGSVSEAFLEADFTYAYVSCAWGIPYIGYVMICYGILLLCFTLLLGCCAVRIVGRLPLMIFCFLIYLGVLAALKFWHPIPEQIYPFFLVAGLWGIADSSTVIITAMYGIVFLGNEEAAFCNLGISRALGYLLGYIMHPLLCMDTKMIIVLVILLVAAAGYFAFEHLWKKASKDKALAALVPFRGWVDVPIKNQSRDEG